MEELVGELLGLEGGWDAGRELSPQLSPEAAAAVRALDWAWAEAALAGLPLASPEAAAEGGGTGPAGEEGQQEEGELEEGEPLLSLPPSPAEKGGAAEPEGSEGPEEELEKLREAVAARFALRRRLDGLDGAGWDEHTARTAAYRFLGPELTRPGTGGEELYITGATPKLLDVLFRFHGLISPQTSVPAFRSLHICEGSGGFVSALLRHQEAVMGRPEPFRQLHWLASTLSPFNEANSSAYVGRDLRFILQSCARNWVWGPSDRGDIFDPATSAAIVERAGDAVRLATADGGYSAEGRERFHELEEAYQNPLVLAETAVALATLGKGGAYVCKLLGICEPCSASLLALFCAAFGRVALSKPLGSKAGSSEVYALGMAFRGREGPEGAACRAFLAAYGRLTEEERRGVSRPIVAVDRLPVAFVRSVAEAATALVHRQTLAIRLNLRAWDLSAAHKDDIFRRLSGPYRAQAAKFANNFASTSGRFMPKKDWTVTKMAKAGGPGRNSAELARPMDQDHQVDLKLEAPLTKAMDIELGTPLTLGSPVEEIKGSLALSAALMVRYGEARRLDESLPSLDSLDLCPPFGPRLTDTPLPEPQEGQLIVNLAGGRPSKAFWARLFRMFLLREEAWWDVNELVVEASEEQPYILLVSRWSLCLVVVASAFFKRAQLKPPNTSGPAALRFSGRRLKPKQKGDLRRVPSRSIPPALAGLSETLAGVAGGSPGGAGPAEVKRRRLGKDAEAEAAAGGAGAEEALGGEAGGPPLEEEAGEAAAGAEEGLGGAEGQSEPLSFLPPGALLQFRLLGGPSHYGAKDFNEAQIARLLDQ